jgi:hypothetical protein
MAKLSVKDIQSAALHIINGKPGGIRLSSVVEQVHQQSPETPIGTIRTTVSGLDKKLPNDITKPERGLFAPVGRAGSDTVVVPDTETVAPTGIQVKEADFYAPFAEWLKDDLGEVNSVISLGGAGLKSKFGTPDVVGTYKPLAGDLIKFPVEIVSAEIKIDPQAPVVAFGQAAAYRLFSTKTYIAMPTNLTEEDKGRLESLCMLFGIGLVLFDLNKDSPAFSIRMRAQRFFPDMFYVNEFAERLKAHDGKRFQDLFG